MSKARVVFTPEQKLEYWKKRTFAKVKSSVTQFDITFGEAVAFARHIGVNNKDLEEIIKGHAELMQKFITLVYDIKVARHEIRESNSKKSA